MTRLHAREPGRQLTHPSSSIGKHSFLGASLLVFTAFAAACTSSTSSGSAQTDGGSNEADGGGDDTSDVTDAGPCEAIANTAHAISSTVDETDPAPAASGGTLTDGTYELTSIVYYDVRNGQGTVTGSGGAPIDTQQTMQIAGNVIDSVRLDTDAPGSTPFWQSATYTTSGSQLMETSTCNSGNFGLFSGTVTYAADACHVLTFEPPVDLGGELGMSGERVSTWTKK